MIGLKNSAPERLNHLFWDLGMIPSASFNIFKESTRTHYPIRSLRYWFMCHLLSKEFLRKNRSLSVCEVGVDAGQMLQFIKTAKRSNQAIEWSCWSAVDVDIREEALAEIGYTDCIRGDIEAPSFSLPKKYDAMVLLHILEHLDCPERVFENLARYVADGGIVIGGSPVLPHCLAPFRENRLRRTARKHGHISVFSLKRVRAMARKNNFELIFLSGGFLMRSKGLFLENFAWWMRLNLFFGALLPWRGEIYWMMRKPES